VSVSSAEFIAGCSFSEEPARSAGAGIGGDGEDFFGFDVEAVGGVEVWEWALVIDGV